MYDEQSHEAVSVMTCRHFSEIVGTAIIQSTNQKTRFLDGIYDLFPREVFDSIKRHNDINRNIWTDELIAKNG